MTCWPGPRPIWTRVWSVMPLRWVEDGTVKITRPVYAGKLLSTTFVTEGTQFVSLRSRAFAAAAETGNSGEAEWVERP
jgi:electron transfer flavoprotein alpha subunit